MERSSKKRTWQVDDGMDPMLESKLPQHHLDVPVVETSSRTGRKKNRLVEQLGHRRALECV